ncbi:MAG: heat-inducible transcriptional repressor HrcA [Candidatus Zixiibacteriota bacterium]
MAFENLSVREKEVLACLVSHYVETADPVGSRVIANKFKLGISPATIRNTMQDLEEMGMVTQPHTSAGRIPTDSGYRLYVDMLLGREMLTESEKKAINDRLSPGYGGIDSVLEQTSRVLANLSNQIGLTVSPKLDNSILTRIELIPMAEGRVLVVLVFRSGLARTILLEIEASIGNDELSKMSQVLNEKLSGLTLGEIRNTIQKRLSGSRGNPRLLRIFLDENSEIWNSVSTNQLHIGGTENLLGKPEFANRKKLQDLIRLLETPAELIHELNAESDLNSGLIITIGAENKAKEIQSCSVVSASYKVGSTSGTIGVIGPTRMPYGKLASLVKYAARQLSKALKNN